MKVDDGFVHDNWDEEEEEEEKAQQKDPKRNHNGRTSAPKAATAKGIAPTAGASRNAAGVAMDENFLADDWDEEPPEAAPENVKKMNGNPSQLPRSQDKRTATQAQEASAFVNEDWDDESGGSDQEHAALKPPRSQPHPGVAADNNFATADWDDSD